MKSFEEVCLISKNHNIENKKKKCIEYKLFMNYIKDLIHIIFETYEGDIVSYLKNMNKDNNMFKLPWYFESNLFEIFLGFDEKDETLCIKKLYSSKSVFINEIDFNSSDNDIVNFFDDINYLKLVNYFIPLNHYKKEKYVIDSIVKKFNDDLFYRFSYLFNKDLNLSLYDFYKSEYALSFTVDQYTKLNICIIESYKSFLTKCIHGELNN